MGCMLVQGGRWIVDFLTLNYGLRLFSFSLFLISTSDLSLYMVSEQNQDPGEIMMNLFMNSIFDMNRTVFDFLSSSIC